jgi:polyisoprenoid-binding protein YceI
MMSTTTTTTVSARTYAIDKAHSEAAFQVRHLLSKVRGVFADFDGTIDFDPDAPASGAVKVTIHVASINTNEPARDAHLRSDDFFAADQFPTLTFESRAVSIRNVAEFDVLGDLTIRGNTRPVTLTVTYLGAAKDPWGHERVAFEAETTLNRKDFGLHWNAALETGGLLVGDDVRIQLSIQAVAQ